MISHSDRPANVWFDMTKTNGATPIRGCSQAGVGGCRANTDAQGNRW